MGLKVHIYQSKPNCEGDPYATLLMENNVCVMWEGIGLKFGKKCADGQQCQSTAQTSTNEDYVQVTQYPKGCSDTAYFTEAKVNWHKDGMSHPTNKCDRLPQVGYPLPQRQSSYWFTLERHSSQRVNFQRFRDTQCMSDVIEYPWLVDTCWNKFGFSYRAKCYGHHVTLTSYAGSKCTGNPMYRANFHNGEKNQLSSPTCTVPNVEVTQKLEKDMIMPYEDCSLKIEQAEIAYDLLKDAQPTLELLMSGKFRDTLDLIRQMCTQSQCLSSYLCNQCVISDFDRSGVGTKVFVDQSRCQGALGEVTENILGCTFSIPANASVDGYCIEARGQQCSYKCNDPYKPRAEVTPWKCGVTANPEMYEVKFQSRSAIDQFEVKVGEGICVEKKIGEVTCDAFDPTSYMLGNNTSSGHAYVKSGCQQGGSIGDPCVLSCEPNWCCLRRTNDEVTSSEFAESLPSRD